jgi:hypothetical protein
MSLSHVTIVITHFTWSALECHLMKSQGTIGNAKSASKLIMAFINCSLKSEGVKDKREQIKVQIAERERKI